MMFRFQHPVFLLFILVIPMAVYFRKRFRNPLYLRVSDTSQVRGVGRSPALRLRTGITCMKLLSLVLIAVAIARPQLLEGKTTIHTEGINIILAVDLSRSMSALDFRLDGKIVNRLTAIKDVVETFVSNRKADRIGMVVFGTNAYTQAPLNRDYNFISSILHRLEIGAAGDSTAIGDAIGISIKRLADIKSKSNIIILLTDGSSNAGEIPPETAAEIAKQKGIKIYTIGVGTRGEVRIPVNHPVFGRQFVYQKMEIDEKTLKKIAETTGGLYFRAENTQGLKEIYATIDKLEKTEEEVEVFVNIKELYAYALFPAFLFLSLWVLLTNTRFVKIP